MGTKTDKKSSAVHTRKTKKYHQSMSDFCSSAWMHINGVDWSDKKYRLSFQQVFQFKKDDNEPEQITI